VHEKLQNFCAPEDRTTKTDEAVREFFGSLFGANRLLGEDGDEDDGVGARVVDDGDGDGDGGREVEALRLFRS